MQSHLTRYNSLLAGIKIETFVFFIDRHLYFPCKTLKQIFEQFLLGKILAIFFGCRNLLNVFEYLAGTSVFKCID